MNQAVVHTVGAPGSIVVGIDPSETAKAALTSALRLAARLGLPCHVVHAWAFPVIAMSEGFAPTGAMMDLGPEETKWLDTLTDQIDTGGVSMTHEVRRGNAGSVLVDVARAPLNAPYLFVGAVGHGAIIATLLGSVSQYCVHHAGCPVVVVPAATHGAAALRMTARVDPLQVV